MDSVMTHHCIASVCAGLCMNNWILANPLLFHTRAVAATWTLTVGLYWSMHQCVCLEPLVRSWKRSISSVEAPRHCAMSLPTRNTFPAAARPSNDMPGSRTSFDPQVEQSPPSAPVDGGLFTTSFLRKVKSATGKHDETAKSPESRTSEPTSPKSRQGEATAAAMLAPVLSRVRERHRQAEQLYEQGRAFFRCAWENLLFEKEILSNWLWTKDKL